MCPRISSAAAQSWASKSSAEPSAFLVPFAMRAGSVLGKCLRVNAARSVRQLFFCITTGDLTGRHRLFGNFRCVISDMAAMEPEPIMSSPYSQIWIAVRMVMVGTATTDKGQKAAWNRRWDCPAFLRLSKTGQTQRRNQAEPIWQRTQPPIPKPHASS